MSNKGLNRIKVVLVEQRKTSKWLAEQLGKGEATISKWCTNRSQPSLETLVEIARVLQVDVKDLLQSTIEDQPMVYIKLPNNNGLQF
ncbi:MAG: helix-turn-helix domain-containing protein [Prevotella sp.]|jgi:transcriptional regulator with XRE-family HTH domain|nr:helix-turn-helix domain-containing protein [Prevotella sp.]MCI7509522.1 helix-turn-helix domain-containing protein [Prevotella sp.]